MVELDGDRLRRLQRTLSSMLSDFDSACRRIGVAYTLGGGSCLGAVRHRGFIPWDDDVDLNMPRADFERLAASFEDELGDAYLLQIPGSSPGYELAFPRVRKRGTVLRSREDFGERECGVYIDIFLIENVPNNRVLRTLHGLGSMALGLATSCRRFSAHESDYLRLAGDSRELVSTFRTKALLGRPLSFMSPEGWARVWDRWNGACGNGESSHVSIPVGRRHYFGELQERGTLLPPVRGSFEGMSLPLPADVGAYLCSLYGSDYMTPPSERDRERHVVLEFDLGDSDEEGGPVE